MIAQRIAVVGAGAWGTALANVIARAGRAVTLVGPRSRRGRGDHGEAGKSAIAGGADRRAGGGRGPLGGTPGGRLEGDAILIVVPAQTLRGAVGELGGAVAPGTPVVACAKGIERGTGRFMTEIIAECLPAASAGDPVGAELCGDVARGLPTAVTLAAPDEATAKMLAHSLGSATFRPYHSTDVRGVEIGGAAKNVLAIAAGIVSGRKLGASAAAALTTRGFAELVRFGRAHGARPETLTGLSGLGDLILTCSSAQSRNFQLGRMLGEGRSLDEVRRAGELAEGVFTARVLVEMARGAQGRNADRRRRRRSARREARHRRGHRGAADAAIPRGGMKMNYWLIKSEPDTWSWDQQVEKGAKGEAWTGVRNHTAKQNLVKMKKGDRAFFYHSGEGKEIVGIAEVIREELSRSDRVGRRSLGRGRREGDDAARNAGHPRGDQGGAEAQGDGARQVLAAFGAAGDGAGMEPRLRHGRGEAVTARAAWRAVSAHFQNFAESAGVVTRPDRAIQHSAISGRHPLRQARRELPGWRSHRSDRTLVALSSPDANIIGSVI